MKISHEFIGKEVINEIGNVIGIVEDVEWDICSNYVENIILKNADILGQIGLGKRVKVPYMQISAIGDRVLVYNL